MRETQWAIPRCQSGELWKEDFHLNAYHSSPGSDNIICFQRKTERLNAELFPGALRSGVFFFLKKKIKYFLGGGRIAPISACSPLLKALQSCPLRKEGMARGRCSFGRIAHRQWLQGPSTQQDLGWGGRSLLQKSPEISLPSSQSQQLRVPPLSALGGMALASSDVLLPPSPCPNGSVLWLWLQWSQACPATTSKRPSPAICSQAPGKTPGSSQPPSLLKPFCARCFLSYSQSIQTLTCMFLR